MLIRLRTLAQFETVLTTNSIRWYLQQSTITSAIFFQSALRYNFSQLSINESCLIVMEVGLC